MSCMAPHSYSQTIVRDVGVIHYGIFSYIKRHSRDIKPDTDIARFVTGLFRPRVGGAIFEKNVVLADD